MPFLAGSCRHFARSIYLSYCTMMSGKWSGRRGPSPSSLTLPRGSWRGIAIRLLLWRLDSCLSVGRCGIRPWSWKWQPRQARMVETRFWEFSTTKLPVLIGPMNRPSLGPNSKSKNACGRRMTFCCGGRKPRSQQPTPQGGLRSRYVLFSILLFCSCWVLFGRRTNRFGCVARGPARKATGPKREAVKATGLQRGVVGLRRRRSTLAWFPSARCFVCCLFSGMPKWRKYNVIIAKSLGTTLTSAQSWISPRSCDYP